MSDKPVFTQRMMMHLNGGSSYSVLEFRVYADGKPTAIKRVKRTSGRPKYLIEVDTFACGGDEFDVVATKGVGMMEWLIAHVAVEPKVEATTS